MGTLQSCSAEGWLECEQIESTAKVPYDIIEGRSSEPELHQCTVVAPHVTEPVQGNQCSNMQCVPQMCAVQSCLAEGWLECKQAESTVNTSVDIIDGGCNEPELIPRPLVLPKHDEPSQGMWYSDANSRIIGNMKNSIIIWDNVQFDEELTNQGGALRDYETEWLGTSHHDTLENRLNARLHWSIGDSWVWLDPSGNALCARKAAGHGCQWVNCVANGAQGRAQIKLALSMKRLSHPVPRAMPNVSGVSFDQKDLQDHCALQANLRKRNKQARVRNKPLRIVHVQAAICD